MRKAPVTRAPRLIAPQLTVFSVEVDSGGFAADLSKIDRLSAIAAETEQIPNRGNSPLNSGAQISDGSGSRFFVVPGENLPVKSKCYDPPKPSSGSRVYRCASYGDIAGQMKGTS